MTQKEVFGSAKWMRGKDAPAFSVLRSRFSVTGIKTASLRVLGLGFFHCYLNGVEVTEDKFLPLSTDYEPRDNYPIDEILTGHRIYVPEFDVTNLLKTGENIMEIHFGGGWYTYEEGPYGTPKAIFRLSAETETGHTEIVSSEKDEIGTSFVSDYHLTQFEYHDYTLPRVFRPAVEAEPLVTEYLFTDCPTDRKERDITPTFLNRGNCLRFDDTFTMTPDPHGNAAVYDAGCNITGWPLLRVTAPKGETVTVVCTEELDANGMPNRYTHWNQHFSVVSDGTERLVHPLFTWFGFRYFAVIGSAEVVSVEVVRMPVRVTSSFDSDNKVLNWLYKAYINTELSNMHAGIISDCPHIERRGYTGDGQLTCHAVMDMMDAKSLYRKWIGDIGDCQDILSGHIQYTAPYIRSGGGPGGWGCAIIEVPYQFYRHYGDAKPLKELYPQMLRYFDYLEAHSENGLVISDKAGEWALGDWCTPIRVVLPAAFVNNYFYVKSLGRMIEIARLIGRECDIPLFEKRMAERKQAMTAAYFNTWDSNFIGGLQGANAFALDIGLGNRETYDNLVAYYTKLGCLDTGIFGSEVVPKVLFEHGDSELAVKLLSSEQTHSYGGMMRRGATSLWEYWPCATRDRSHNHPMFGAPAAFLFDYILGIKADGGNISIEPAIVATLSRVSGMRTLPEGPVTVSYNKNGDSLAISVSVPENAHSVLKLFGREYPLNAGENKFSFDKVQWRNSDEKQRI